MKKKSNYFNGNTLRKYYCINCDKEISYGHLRCKSCARKLRRGKENPHYKNGKWIKTVCIDCEKPINPNCKRCKCCSNHRKNFNKKPNKPEKALNTLLNKLLPKEYKYVGNSKFWIEKYNPDFINYNGQKKIIEMFGDYWHNRIDSKQRDKRRIKTYAKYGYKTLIIWEHELKNLNKVKNKILKFD